MMFIYRKGSNVMCNQEDELRYTGMSAHENSIMLLGFMSSA